MRRLILPRRPLASLATDTSGLAMIEFAMVLPALLILGLGGIEVANFAIANLRISQIAMTTADNAGRVRDQISEADINELMAGAKFVGTKLKFAQNGRIILSNLEADGAKQWIRWQRCSGAMNVTSSYGVPLRTNGQEVTSFSNANKASVDYDASSEDSTLTAMGPAGKQIAAAAGTAVMFVEIVYDYQPIVPTRFLPAATIRYTSAFNVRQRTDQTLKRAGLDANAMSTCGRFTA